MPVINIEDLTEKDKLKMEVDQLKKEVKLERAMVSKCCEEIKDYIEAGTAEDPLVKGIPEDKNPFKEKGGYSLDENNPNVTRKLVFAACLQFVQLLWLADDSDTLYRFALQPRCCAVLYQHCNIQKYGGLGLDYSYNIAVAEELGNIRCGGIPMAIGVQSDMTTQALSRFGSSELKKEFLAPTIQGDKVACLGVSEVGAGSDVARIHVARKIDKIGMKSSDTAEIYFDDVRVPCKNVIGEEGMGFTYQMLQFQEERMWGVANVLTPMKNVIQETIEYTRQRKIFNQPVLNNQVVHFRLAELETEVELLRSLLYRAVGMPGATTRLGRLEGPEEGLCPPWITCGLPSWLLWGPRVGGLEAQPCRDPFSPPGGAPMPWGPWTSDFHHTRKCWGEEKQGHPESFRENSRHFRHTGACPGRSAGKHLEPIRGEIKGAVSLHSRLESGGSRTKQERRVEAARRGRHCVARTVWGFECVH
ncbi:IVD dehydrogenase, partial [Polypterus senegalus]